MEHPELTTRIFVGGLGEKVTEEDLHKTFSSLGAVKDVEFVRTNGRDFAYIDFQPSSLKSVPKLFSSYNGCVWKGGRLRLEKAKEHYLVRLRREWEEDAADSRENTDELVADENKDLLRNAKPLTLEKKQLHIFFPRLRKVKSVPYSGTGKHKYSFQRVEVPSLPIHFCDCEEHSGSSEIAKVKQVSDIEEQAGNVNKEELDMMRSVMNKIFKREDKLCTERTNALPFDGVSPTKSGDGASSFECEDDVHFSEAESDQDNDIDNLVINMVNGGHTKSGLMENGSLDNVIQEPYLGKDQVSNVGSTQSMIKNHNEKNIDPFDISDRVSKKPRLVLSDRRNKNEFSASMPQKEGNPGIKRKELEGLLGAQPDEKRSSRRQKSSWKELVGETANSFSLSQILPAAGVTQNLPKSNFDPSSTTYSKRQKLKKQVGHRAINSECKGLVQDEAVQEKVCTGGPNEDTKKLIEQPRGKSSDFVPVGFPKDEIIFDKVSTDGPSIVAQIGSPSKESKTPGDVQSTDKKDGEIQSTDKNGDNSRTRGNHSWIQRSSWRELVGGMDNGSFSMSQILPNVTPSRQKPQSNHTTTAVNPFDKKQQNSSKQFTDEGVGKCDVLHDIITSSSTDMESAKNKETLVGLEAVTGTVEMKLEPEKLDISEASVGKNIAPSNKKRSIDTGIGEVCTFMRSSESEKELMKLRAALSGKHKKKNNEKKKLTATKQL